MTSFPITEPMLAGKGEVEKLVFPLFVTPKIDGIRCLTLPPEEDGKRCMAVSRKMKSIGNDWTREWLEEYLPFGLDGELVVVGDDSKPLNFQACASGIMKSGGQPKFRYCVFDHVADRLDEGYLSRINRLRFMRLPRGFVELVVPTKVATVAELEAYEEAALAEGYEGVMVRSGSSPYKCGRSTAREGYLLKIKRFDDAEGVVLDTYEGMTNQNELQQDAFGRAKRSMAKAGRIGQGRLGGFIVRMESGVEFRLAYNHLKGGADGKTMWKIREELVGKIVKFKFQPTGVKEAPRFPTFLGFRDERDM